MKKTLGLILLIASSFQTFSQTDSLDMMIGQMILIGVKGTSVDSLNETMKAVSEGKAGTVILFEKNIGFIAIAINGPQ